MGSLDLQNYSFFDVIEANRHFSITLMKNLEKFFVLPKRPKKVVEFLPRRKNWFKNTSSGTRLCDAPIEEMPKSAISIEFPSC